MEPQVDPTPITSYDVFMPEEKTEIVTVPDERIVSNIYVVRGKKVMLDRDLAELYGVPTKRLNEQVRRNKKRFPDDFMFRLTEAEYESLRSQSATSNKTGRGGHRYPPLVFTEQGVAMLSTVLNSERAIQVNIQIMRTFTKLRQLLATNDALRRKLEAMEGKYDGQFKAVFNVLRQLVAEEEKPKRHFGYKP